MPALEVFGDFMLATDSAILTGARDLVNEAVKNTYLLRRFLKGNDYSKTIQGGKTIKDQIMFDEQSTRVHYQPNDMQSPSNPQVLDEWEIPWRFQLDQMVWTDQELALNAGGMSKEARFRMYKDLKQSKERRLWTSLLNGMEEDLYRLPNNADMEATTGKVPYSIPAFVNACANTVPIGFTTVEGISPTTQAKWRNQTATYDIGTALGADSLMWNAFDDMFMEVKFDSLPGREEFGTRTSGLYFITCSKWGRKLYMANLRASQDTFVQAGRQDPAYPNPKYAGIDLVYVSQMNDAAVFANADDGTAFVTEASQVGGEDGPRFDFLNGDYLCPVFHSERYMFKKPPMTHPLQPMTTVMYVDCWNNNVARSRQRLGQIGPDGTDVSTVVAQ